MSSKSCLKRAQGGQEDWSKMQKEGFVPGRLKNGVWCFLAPRVLSLLFFRARIGPEAVDRIRKRVNSSRKGKWNEVGKGSRRNKMIRAGSEAEPKGALLRLA